MDEINQIKKLLVDHKIVKHSEFIGCTDAEVRLVAAGQGFQTLPSAYRSFLEVMGKSAGQFLVGIDWSYADIVSGEIRQCLNEELFRYGCGPLRNDAFVFRTDQGVQYYYFVCDCDNPAIRYFWPTAHRHPERLGVELIISELKFTDFLNDYALMFINGN